MRIRQGLLGVVAISCIAVFSVVGALAQKPVSEPAGTKSGIAPPATVDADLNTGKSSENAVRALLVEFAKAYSAPDVEAMAGLFTEDASVVDTNGDEVRGKTAIAEMYATAFQDSPGLKLEAQLDGVRFITADVARAEGRSRLSTGTGDASEFHRFSSLVVHKDGTWRIAEVRDYPMPVEDVTSYERLKELEWMVGDWVDEGSDNKVTASIHWADNKSYLVRAYTVELQGQKASSGTMFIGWDPQTGQIKSWLFDSEGGHGEGLWARTAENQWVVKAQGVLRDGRPTSATQIHTIVNKDAVKTSSIDRILGGQVAPDVPEILMVRKPPQPSSAATPMPSEPASTNK